jgi:hypothetical protein
MQFDLGPDLPALKTKLSVKVDQDAEAARLAFITGGSGQAMEYEATEREARAYVAAYAAAQAAAPTPEEFVDPYVAALYPFIEAERQAVYGATGTLPDAFPTAQVVVAEANGWSYVGASIKAKRRGAKMAIAAATTVGEAHAAAAVVWPTPADFAG